MTRIKTVPDARIDRRTFLFANVALATGIAAQSPRLRFHEERYKQYGDRLADMANLVRDGLQMPVEWYDEAKRYIAESKTKMAEQFKSTPVILTPAAIGPAPVGLSSTGDSRVNSPWSALGTPAITIPMPVGSALPLGLQLTADHGQDARVIRTAVKLERLLASRDEAF